jgi:hypothetical protein
MLLVPEDEGTTLLQNFTELPPDFTEFLPIVTVVSTSNPIYDEYFKR